MTQQWNDYLTDSTLVEIFSHIWGKDEPFPKTHRLRNLKRMSNPLHKLKWLSQQLYHRRGRLFGSGKESMSEFAQRAREEHSKIREAIEKIHQSSDKEVVKHTQNEILFDCGSRGALEIWLTKSFKKCSSRFSYMDKKYDGEIEDLESNLVRERPKNWDTASFVRLFTPVNVTILGFFPLLRLALNHASDVLAYFHSKNDFYVRKGGAWVTETDLRNVCDDIYDALCFSAKEMREMVIEKVDFISVDIPEEEDRFSAWFRRIFDKTHSREFVNAFELVWLVEENDEKTGEPQLNSFIRKEVIKHLSRDVPANEIVLQNSTIAQKTIARKKYKPHKRNDENGPRLGDISFKKVFHPNGGYTDTKKTCTLFAKHWRDCVSNGQFRKSVVEIKRW